MHSCTMANEETKPVWIKLVIDGDQYTVFKVVVKKRDVVDDLKDAIMVVAKSRNMRSFDGGSLDVYVPKNTTVPAGIEQPFRPDLRLSNLDFLGEITYQAPLIVTAKSRPQQQQDTNVSLCRNGRFCPKYILTMHVVVPPQQHQVSLGTGEQPLVLKQLYCSKFHLLTFSSWYSSCSTVATQKRGQRSFCFVPRRRYGR
jgi:hypothetical protein